MQKTKMKKRCRDGVTCVVLCTLPSIYLVCVVFGTAIPTSFYILENVFHTFFKGTMQFFTLTACSIISGASLHTGGEPQISQTDRETGKKLYCI